MHEQMMRRALELAKEAQLAGEVPVGAVVACGGTIIRKGVMNASNRGIQQRTLKFWHFGELRKCWGAGVLKGACCM